MEAGRGEGEEVSDEEAEKRGAQGGRKRGREVREGRGGNGERYNRKGYGWGRGRREGRKVGDG